MKNSRADLPSESLTPPVLPTYARADLAVARGEGPYLFDESGRRYLDFVAGVAVNCLGHCHPALVSALETQARALWHTSNLFRIPGQEKLAERLTELTFADTMFFTNSGAEAIECAIKMARKFQSHNNRPERFRLITFEAAFHGRTLATIAASGQEKMLKGFGPKVDGFDQVAFGDLAAAEAAITPETAGFLIEPVQGEGGIRAATPEFLRGLRALADQHNLVLIFDEIQCGMGRTGKLFAHEWAGVTPDIMAVAKGIGGGFPLGACLATAEAAAGMTAGTHGSTYGGNPLAMAVGNAVLEVVAGPGFLDHVVEIGDYLGAALTDLAARHPDIFADARGQGLIRGLKLKTDLPAFIVAARGQGLLLAAAGDNVVRLLPPLIIERAHVDEAIALLDATAKAVAAEAA
ncbi:aspartate aminotransferase family protein [Govanella unica]|uniref:Acetylornithine aminotransferase n=1 Tax=Govanella unica TaxID=2975056 RepID=A0A9X3Z894_9PROT|nr:aspartate aminotransferase family protein [Govania unica]MDA5194794.1 aspartate aminotransferase family protein [Govania unica]